MTPKVVDTKRYAIGFTVDQAKRLRRLARADAIANPEDDDARRLWFHLDAFLRRRNVGDNE